MKRFLLTTLLAVVFFVSEPKCLAVDGRFDLSEAFNRARAVFIGEVIDLKKPISADQSARLADRLYKVTFKVEYSWKGAGFQELGASNLVVLSDQGRDENCFNDECWGSWGSFREDGKYLVFAEETAEKDLVVRWYSRTAPLFKASEDLKELQRMSSPFYRLSVKR